MTPFNPKEPKRDKRFLVKTHLIKKNSEEFITTVFMDGKAIEAEISVGIEKSLDVTRELADLYSCNYEFSTFPKNPSAISFKVDPDEKV